MWGGDGTVRRCIHTVVTDKMNDVSLGVLPAGTANLLAKNLQIPTDLAAAVQIAVCGEARPLDVGEMNGKCFAVMGGTGFDAMMIKDADEHRLKERFGRAGYVGATHPQLVGDDPRACPSRSTDEPWFTGDASCVLTANVGTILGGIEAFPDASPTDGRLEVGVVQARTRRELGASGGTGGHRASRVLTVRRDQLVSGHGHRARQVVAMGDRRRRPTEGEEVRVRCLPDAVRICQPEVVS